jgi:hypothetical protein
LGEGENLPQDLQRARPIELAGQDAQGGSGPRGPSQPRVSAGHESRGQTLTSSRGPTERDGWSSGRRRLSGREGVPGRVRRQVHARGKNGVRGIRSHGQAAHLAGGRHTWSRPARAVLGQCAGSWMPVPCCVQQEPRNRLPRHGGTTHRRTRTPPERRKGCPAWRGDASTPLIRDPEELLSPTYFRFFR